MRSNPFLQNKQWLLDGGLATELEKRGFDLNHPMWSAKVLVDNARAIYDVHKNYLAAGADIILTSSYQATRDGFVKHFGMYPREAQEALYFMVELASRAKAEYLAELPPEKKREILIGASVGPYGATLADGSEYKGGYDVQDAKVGDYYAQKIETLILPRKDTRADFLAFETVPTAKESELIQLVLKAIPWARAWISFSNAEECLKALPRLNKNDQIWAVGLNCMAPVDIEKSADSLVKESEKPLVFYPNGGTRYDASTKTWSEEARNLDWTSYAGQLWSAGVRIVGGCCQTGPEEISAIAKARSQFEKTQ